jgi:hypothetical protein
MTYYIESKSPSGDARRTICYDPGKARSTLARLCLLKRAATCRELQSMKVVGGVGQLDGVWTRWFTPSAGESKS